MNIRILFTALLAGYAALIIPFSTYMKQRPVAVKLGYTPEAQVIRLVASEYRQIFAQVSVVRVLFYYGTLLDEFCNKLKLQPEYFNMFRTLQIAVKLDPYNMDAYYFAQSAFTWELKRIKEVNDLLNYGMEYRTWDGQLPFYAGFNCAYFLNDFTSAAKYLQEAAKRSNQPLYANLAARYYYQSGSTELGLAFLKSMVQSAKDEKIKKIYQVRIKALTQVRLLERALAGFINSKGTLPDTIDELVRHGFIESIPHDPYGGAFYIDANGRIATTSKFSFAFSRKNNNE